MDRAAHARSAAGCSLAAEVVSLFGEVSLRVTGSSMLPSVWPGDILTICRTDVTRVLAGEIVLFAREGRLLAHRVLCKLESGDEPLLITRGDSVSEADPPVSRRELIGRVTSISRGRRRITPRPHPTLYERIVSFILRHSDRATTVLLRFRELRRGFYHRETESPIFTEQPTRNQTVLSAFSLSPSRFRGESAVPHEPPRREERKEIREEEFFPSGEGFSD